MTKAPLALPFAAVLVFGMIAGRNAAAQDVALPEFILERSFIYEEAPFSACHASTIVETSDGSLVAAWFGGTAEGSDDVEIWVSRRSPGEPWSPPEAVTKYPDIPTWNPVLFQDGDRTVLFFKIGPSPREWIGAYRVSHDGGRTWGTISYLPAGLTGPIRSKPIRLADGSLLSGTSFEAGYDHETPADAPYKSWSVWMERSDDGGATWTKHGPIVVPGQPFGIIQPTLWQADDGTIHAFMRSTNRIGYIVASQSDDGGRSWTQGVPTELPNPNSGIDAARLQDGRIVLIYNHTTKGRSPIHIAVSSDDGATWTDPAVLEDGPGEFSYPAIVQARSGHLHVTYTWQRKRIRHLVIDPSGLPH